MRKFHRERDQREALIKGLAESLIIHHSIETTLAKAKAVVPYVEKLITKARKGDLHNRRQIISALLTVQTAHKLVDEMAPKLKGRHSGHLRIERTVLRRGDNAQLARVSFVDDLKAAPPAELSKQSTAKSKTAAKPSKQTTAKSKTVAKAGAKPAGARRSTAVRSENR